MDAIISLLLFLSCLVCMLFYCMAIGHYVGTITGRLMGRAVLAFIYGINVVVDGSEPINIKGTLAWKKLKISDGEK